MSSDLRPSQASADLAAQNGDAPMSDSDRILEKSIRTLLFLLLVLIVTLILVASIVFSDDSRVFLLKFAAAALLSIIPGWIYLQFIRNKGPSLYDEYVLNLFRLEIDEIANLPAPPQHTSWFAKWHKYHKKIVAKSVTDNLYRRKFESVYGRAAVSTIGLVRKKPLSLREKTETFTPVVMATIVITMAWALVLQPELLRNINILPKGFALSGKPEGLPTAPLQFGFIGAYAFIILDLGRRYFRDDLKAAAYISATMRIIFASALIVAMGAAGFTKLVTDSEAKFVAFFIGFFPRAGFTWLRALLPGKLQAAIPQLESDYPLRNLEGLNIWYETRLIEEGIESMQNLCTASLVDIMLKTRIPIARVVDWLDQAYLYLHLAKDPNHPELPPPGLATLRQLGVRTATDLERTWANVKEITSDGKVRELLGKALIPEDVDKADAVVSSIMMSLEGEPNLWHVRAFRQLDWLKAEHKAPDEPEPEVSVRLDPSDDDQNVAPAAAGQVSPQVVPAGAAVKK
ncbi:MAG TPA: hypothetical protein VHV50_05535 [Actinomycetota bacterium]|jgi:hypothetical protein|nr:hypothetical protein [Actinomycetota bacterium]